MYQDNLSESSSAELAVADFETVHSAVLETERGRWFLSEFARRQRAAETSEILTAVDQLTRRVVSYESFLAQMLSARETRARSGPELRDVAESRAAAPVELRLRGDLSRRLDSLREIDELGAEAKLKLFA
jgi:hypothetical protein